MPDIASLPTLTGKPLRPVGTDYLEITHPVQYDIDTRDRWMVWRIVKHSIGCPLGYPGPEYAIEEVTCIASGRVKGEADHE